MRIFIGSASGDLLLDPAKGLAADNIDPASISAWMARRLSESGHDVFAWWETKAIPDQSRFFQRIEMLADACDLGIFFLGRRHPIADTAATFVSSENVLIELGLFIGRLGRERALAIPAANTTHPTDFSDLKWTSYNYDDQRELIWQCVEERIREVERQRGDVYTEYQLFVNNALHTTTMHDNEVARMSTKAIFLGRDQAVQWAALEMSDSYLPPAYQSALARYVNATFRDVRFDTAISFGPGVGRHDQVVVAALNPRPRYVPIDINPHLAMEALKNCHSRSAPAAIVDDFETHMEAVIDLVRRHFNDPHDTALFMMLGGTFSNLDDPMRFLVSARLLFDDAGDRFLLDVFERESAYTIAADVSARTKQDGLGALLVTAIHNKARVALQFRDSEQYVRFAGQSYRKQLDETLAGSADSLVSFGEDQTGTLEFRLRWEDDSILNPKLLRARRYKKAELFRLIEDAGLEIVSQQRVRLVRNVVSRRLIVLKKK